MANTIPGSLPAYGSQANRTVDQVTVSVCVNVRSTSASNFWRREVVHRGRLWVFGGLPRYCRECHPRVLHHRVQSTMSSSSSSSHSRTIVSGSTDENTTSHRTPRTQHGDGVRWALEGRGYGNSGLRTCTIGSDINFFPSR
ncbi:uncharacterized protein PV06_00120 [Exophiala oligosperma]|uniref:Uncharacterized protein n=1 Tax=Exophiala oligosperma TaxID=215243 RepID=A0A0D2DWG5_9EURO|nr:uncharacterized protein PV06_00120 [Exophiala oligosperma]KIW47423.1 hypothetical protein PV06_00120 [Exophiala oligosperma]